MNFDLSIFLSFHYFEEVGAVVEGVAVGDEGFSSLICFIKYAFSSLNCSSSLRSLWKFWRKSISFSRFRIRMSRIGLGLFGFATNTLKTWKASNWIFRAFSFSIFIISFKLSGLEIYLVITEKLCRSRRSSPNSLRD